MRKITIVTGSRAEYGLLKPLIKRFEDSPLHELHLIVTGMHMSPEFGLTYREINGDGVKIFHKIDMLLSSDTAEGISKSVGLGLISFADLFQRDIPDLLIVLGDRTEILAVCIAAMIKGIPIAHISGGETTEGAYDEAIRHSITKMSYLHFTATREYYNRVVQLGEYPDRVFNVGAIGVESIKTLPLLSRAAFEESINFTWKGTCILVTFHPVTLEVASAEEHFAALLKALDQLKHASVIFTKPNSDKGGRVISRMIDDYVHQNSERSMAVESLGHLRYLSALQFVDVVAGNSSSGIVEVPYFYIPTINIGDRQKGRMMPTSVINCEPVSQKIIEAFDLAFSEKFRKDIKYIKSPYGDGTTSQQIFDIISRTRINDTKKKFYDISPAL